MIDIKYINEYDTWTKLVWALHNDNLNNYELARNMSMRSSKFDDDFFSKLWSETRSGCGIGTIHYYAYHSNPKKYIVLNPNDHLTGTDDNLTKIFSTSSPTYPASVKVVASAIVKGTSNILAKVCAKRVFPQPVGPTNKIFDFDNSTFLLVLVS